MVARGTNPGGAAASLKEPHGQAWWRHYESPPGSTWEQLPPVQAEPGLRSIRARLDANLGEALFSGAARDIESIGIGWVEPKGAVHGALPYSDNVNNELLKGCIRVLGSIGAYPGSKAFPATDMPGRLKAYLEAVTTHLGGIDGIALQIAAEDALRASGVIGGSFMLDIEGLAVRYLRNPDAAWRCPSCARMHLHPICGRLHEPWLPGATHGEGPAARRWGRLLRLALRAALLAAPHRGAHGPDARG